MAETHPIPTDYRFQDLTGRKFNRWTVLSYAGYARSGAKWKCRCDCGVVKIVTQSYRLTAGLTQSCGCLKRERTSETKRTHGMTGTPEHGVWKTMIQRCTNPNADRYARYGGRGITVCKRWEKSFAAFLEDMGPRPSSDHSIERLDNDDNYCKANCMWATRSQQGRNKRNNRLLTFQERRQPLDAWAKQVGIERRTLHARLALGWSIERALTEPVHRRKPQAGVSATTI